jgi:hypothetical protein
MFKRVTAITLCAIFVFGACGNDNHPAPSEPINQPAYSQPIIETISQSTKDWEDSVETIWHGKIDGNECIRVTKRFTTSQGYWSYDDAISCNFSTTNQSGAK